MRADRLDGIDVLFGRVTGATDQRRIVTTLARDLSASVQEVEEVFREQFARLSSAARLHQFLVTLAVRNTRATLRERRRVGTPGSTS